MDDGVGRGEPQMLQLDADAALRNVHDWQASISGTNGARQRWLALYGAAVAGAMPRASDVRGLPLGACELFA